MTEATEDAGGGSRGATQAWDAAALAAVAVAGTGGRAGEVLLEPVVPVAAGGAVGLLLPFDRTALAEALAAAGHATLVTWDARLALRGWTALAAAVAVDVAADLDGAWVDEGWLQPLLRTHPPSRALLDTPLLRREHWWAVPRWRVTATRVLETWALPRRTGPDQALLAWDGAAPSPSVAAVAAPAWTAEVVELAWLGGRALPESTGAVAALLHDVRVPDLDHECALHLGGRLDGGSLHVRSRTGSAALAAPPSLWRRLRDARARERSCRRAIEAAEAAAGSRRPPPG
jgi:hypothetical protein